MQLVSEFGESHVRRGNPFLINWLLVRVVRERLMQCDMRVYMMVM